MVARVTNKLGQTGSRYSGKWRLDQMIFFNDFANNLVNFLLQKSIDDLRKNFI